MTEQFAEDLARWERGELSSAGLAGRHSPEAVQEVMDLWVHLSEAGRGPEMDAARGWAAVEGRLRDRREDRAGAWRRRRLVALVAAAVLAVGSAAYAVGPAQVRTFVDGAVSGIADLFGGGRPPHGPRPMPSPPLVDVSPTAGPDPSPTGPLASPRPSPRDDHQPPAVKPEPGGKTDDEGSGQGEEASPEPTEEPTEEPSPEPSPEPSEEPTQEPTPEPSASDEPTPSEEPTPSPTA